MFDILFGLLAFIFEFIFELLVWYPWEWGITYKDRQSGKQSNLGVWMVFSFLAGSVLGAASTFVFGEYFIASNGLRIFQLILSPFVAGFVAFRIGTMHQTKYDSVDISLHFWCAFIFVLSFGTIRYFLIGS